MKITKTTVKRAVRTFVQAALAFALVSLKNGVDFTADDAVRGFAAGLIAAGLAAVMNLEKTGECGDSQKMSFDSFVEKYEGKLTDYDGAYGVQCVDLAKLYIDKVLGVKPQSIGNAHAYFDNFENTYLKDLFIKIPYKKGKKAKRGDLVVWGKLYNGRSQNGHIAIATGVQNSVSITTYDENWGSKEMKKVVHSLSGISGFLRPVEALQADEKQYFKKCRKSEISIVDALCKAGENFSFEYRKSVALANGITDYKGSAAQNVALLKLMKKGKLIKP